MRVAFIEQESQLGGVEYTTLRVAQSLDKSKFEPLIICPEEGDLPRLARQSGLNVQIVPRPRFSSVSFFWNQHYIANPFGFLITAIHVFRTAHILCQYLGTNSADVIITKGLLAHFYGGLAARKLGIPCIWYVQEEVDAKRGGGLYRWILNWGAQNIPARLIVDAAALLEQFNNTGGVRDAVKVIYNGIDTQQFTPFSQSDRQTARKSFDIPSDAAVIGQTGRIIPLKGQTTLLQAFAILAQDFPNLHLLFVGAPLFGDDHYEQVLRRQALQSGMAERIHFTGFLPDVREGLAAMDVFVQASVETDSPVSVMEAMSCGLPVIVSGVRGTLEMVEPESDALIFPPGDSDALILKLATLIRDGDLRMRLGSKARESVIQKFSLQASVAKLETVLEEVHAA
jgi:glycosyltransferase involved in cell wall biosynthesis